MSWKSNFFRKAQSRPSSLKHDELVRSLGQWLQFHQGQGQGQWCRCKEHGKEHGKEHADVTNKGAGANHPAADLHQPQMHDLAYIDGFAGAGRHGCGAEGSPLLALRCAAAVADANIATTCTTPTTDTAEVATAESGCAALGSHGLGAPGAERLGSHGLGAGCGTHDCERQRVRGCSRGQCMPDLRSRLVFVFFERAAETAAALCHTLRDLGTSADADQRQRQTQHDEHEHNNVEHSNAGGGNVDETQELSALGFRCVVVQSGFEAGIDDWLGSAGEGRSQGGKWCLRARSLFSFIDPFDYKVRSARIRWLLEGAGKGCVVDGVSNTPSNTSDTTYPRGVDNCVCVLYLATQWARSALLMREVKRAPLEALLGQDGGGGGGGGVVDRLATLCREQETAVGHAAIVEAVAHCVCRRGSGCEGDIEGDVAATGTGTSSSGIGGASEVGGSAGAASTRQAFRVQVANAVELRGGKSHVLVFRSETAASAGDHNKQHDLQEFKWNVHANQKTTHAAEGTGVAPLLAPADTHRGCQEPRPGVSEPGLKGGMVVGGETDQPTNQYCDTCGTVVAVCQRVPSCYLAACSKHIPCI